MISKGTSTKLLIWLGNHLEEDWRLNEEMIKLEMFKMVRNFLVYFHRLKKRHIFSTGA